MARRTAREDLGVEDRDRRLGHGLWTRDRGCLTRDRSLAPDRLASDTTCIGLRVIAPAADDDEPVQAAARSYCCALHHARIRPTYFCSLNRKESTDGHGRSGAFIVMHNVNMAWYRTYAS